MPKIFRLMQPATDGKPLVGAKFCQLGVRPNKDVHADANGNVHPGKKEGMSVSPSVSKMNRLVLHVPREFSAELEGAAGDGRYAVFTHGEGPFADSPVNHDICLALTPVDHGVLEPGRMMRLDTFAAALGVIRSAWKKAEPKRR